MDKGNKSDPTIKTCLVNTFTVATSTKRDLHPNTGSDTSGCSLEGSPETTGLLGSGTSHGAVKGGSRVNNGTALRSIYSKSTNRGKTIRKATVCTRACTRSVWFVCMSCCIKPPWLKVRVFTQEVGVHNPSAPSCSNGLAVYSFNFHPPPVST